MRADLAAVCRANSGPRRLVLLRPAEDVDAKIWTAPVAFSHVSVIGRKRVVTSRNGSTCIPVLG